jgi:cytoplasmic iron level regulating protein YaaA (DUF328/UPF0246 family)
MIFVISPAKALDFETPAHLPDFTLPGYLEQSAQLIEILRTFTPADIAQLMDLSDQLATLNVARYASWSLPFTPDNAKQAVLAFNGDVYEGLDAKSLSAAQLQWAQQHLRILSGLYGVLKPLDLIQAYRLEMGTRLANPAGRNLYAFWGETLTRAIVAELEAAGGEAVLVNLASDEYFKSLKGIDKKVRVVTPVFEDWKGGRYKIISFYAKRARGLMARYAIENQISMVEGLLGFNAEGYALDAAASEGDTLVFRRKLEA